MTNAATGKVDVKATALKIQTELNKLKFTSATGSQVNLAVKVTGVTVDGSPITAETTNESFKANSWDITFTNKELVNVDLLQVTSASVTPTVTTVKDGVHKITDMITFVADNKAANIIELKNKLNELLGEGSVTVKEPRFGSTAANTKLNIVFNDPGDVVLTKALKNLDGSALGYTTPVTGKFELATTAAKGKVEGNTGQLSLTVERLAPRPTTLSTDAQASGLVDELLGESVFETFVFTDVGENTIVRGGVNANTFSIAGKTNFKGTVIGGTGLKPLSAQLLNVDSLVGMLSLTAPDFAVKNTVDISGGTFADLRQISYVNLANTSKSSVAVDTVVDGHRGAEIQRLSIPEAQRGSFTLTVQGDTATVTTAPIYLSAPVQQQLLVTDSTDFNLTYVTSTGVQTITGLSTGAATDDISTTIANQINTKLATEFGLAAGTKVVSVTKNQAGYLITYTNQNNMVEFTGVLTSASGNVAVFTKETKAALNYVAVAQRIENAIYKAMALPAGTPKTILVTAGETAGTFDLHWRVVGDKAITTLTDISLSAPVVDLTLTASTTGSPQVHEITIPQAVGASPYNLYIGTYKTVELERDADKNAVQSALQKLINQKPTLKGTVTVTGTAAGPFTISIAGGSVASIVAKNSVFTGTVLGTSTITSQLTNGQEVQSLNINGASRGVVGLQYNLKTYADNSLVTGSVFVDVTLQAGETADTLRGRIEAALNTELAGKATATVTLSGDKFVITLSSLTHIVESMGGTGYGLSSAATDQSLTPVKVGRIDAYLDRTDSSNTTLVETNRIYKFAMPPVVAGETISGSFTLGFGGVTTGAINYSADNTTLLANINAALTASAINTLPVTLEGNEFRVEVVVDLSAAEQALIVDGSALQIVKDTAVAAPGVPANIVTIANGSAVSVGEKQRVTLVDQSLTSFRLSVNGISTLDIPVNQNDATTRGAIQSALDAALGANKVTVTVNPDSSKTKSWILEVTGTSRLNDTDTLVAGDNA